MDIELQFSPTLLRNLLDERLKTLLVACRAPTKILNRELAVAQIQPGTSTLETDVGPHKIRLGGTGSDFTEIHGRRLIYRVPLTLPLLEIVSEDAAFKEVKGVATATVDIQVVVDAHADGGSVFITVSPKSVTATVTVASGESLPTFLMEPVIADRIQQELAKGASTKLSLPALNLAPGACPLPEDASLTLSGNVRNAGLVPAEDLSHIAIGLELGLDQTSVAETWTAFFNGPSTSLLTPGAPDFAIRIDGPRLARYIAGQVRCALQKESSIASIDSIDGYWTQPEFFDLLPFMVHVDTQVDVETGDQTIDNVDVDVWVHFAVPAPGQLRLSTKIGVDIGFWEGLWETLKAAFTGMKFGLAADPTPFGIGAAIGFVLGPFVAAYKLLFENPEIEAILPDCKTEDDGLKQICTFALPVSSSAVGTLRVTEGATDATGLVLRGSAIEIKTKDLPSPPLIQTFPHQMRWGLGCPSKIEADTPPKIVLEPDKVTVGSPGTPSTYPIFPCEYRASADPLEIYSLYLQGLANGWTFYVGVKKGPEEIAALGANAYPFRLMVRTSAGFVIHEFQPPLWSEQIKKKLEAEWPVARQTCQFKHIVAEANWHQKELEFPPDPTHLDPTGMLEQNILFSMSNLVAGEAVTVVDPAGAVIETAVPGSTGWAWGHLPARHLSAGFTLQLRTTEEGDRIRRGSPRTSPGPFAIWLYSWQPIGAFSVLGRPSLLLPSSGASGLLQVLAEGTLSSIRLGMRPVLADQIAVAGATRLAGLTEEALVLGGSFGLAQLLLNGRAEVTPLEVPEVGPVLGLARQRDRLFVLTEDRVTSYRIRAPLRTSVGRAGRFALERIGEAVIDSPTGLVLSGNHLAVATRRGITALAVTDDALRVAGSVELGGIARISQAERRMGGGMVYVELANGAPALVDLSGIQDRRTDRRNALPVTRLGARPIWVNRPTLGELRFDAGRAGRVVVEVLRDRVNLLEQLRR